MQPPRSLRSLPPEGVPVPSERPGGTEPLSIRRDDLLPGRNFIGRWCEAQEGRRFEVTATR